MHATRALLNLLLATGLVCGQAPIRSPQPRTAPNAPLTTDSTPPKKPGTVEGVVTNSVSGQPVKKATVTLRNAIQRFAYSVVTDAAGHFLFENVEPGPYQAMAAGDGFMPDLARRSPLSFRPIMVAEEQHVKDVAVKLLPLALVSGHVLDEDGDPIAGANLQALRYIYSQGRKQLNPWGYANTNDLGEFQMLDLQPGRYYFQVTVRPQQTFSPGQYRGGDENFPVTYYPSAADIAQATSVDATAGAQLNNMDFRLRKVRCYRVRGKLVDGNGQAARNVAVQLTPSGAGANPFSRSFAPVQQDGSFEIRGVASGSYIAVGQRQEAGVSTFARQEVNISDQDLEGVLLVLVPGLEISGRVLVEGAEASPPPQPGGAQPPQQQSPQVTLQPVESMGQGGHANVDSDGTFTFHNIMPGVYQLGVSGPSLGKYLKTIRFGEREVPSAEIDLTSQSGGSITLVYATDGGQIQGTVQSKNGDPAAGVTITIAPREEFEGRRDLFKQSYTDQSGSFRVQDIPPGNYKIFAWEQFDFQSMQAPEFRKVFESRAATVSLGANSHESVQLKAISADDIEAEKSKLP